MARRANSHDAFIEIINYYGSKQLVSKLEEADMPSIIYNIMVSKQLVSTYRNITKNRMVVIPSNIYNIEGISEGFICHKIKTFT